MIGGFAAEMLKLCKRPAIWALCFVFVSAVPVFGYLLTYAMYSTPIPGEVSEGSTSPEQGAVAVNLMETLLPENLTYTVLLTISNFGVAVALVLGVLVLSAEYGWGTLRTVLIQHPGRFPLLLGKLLAVGVVLGVFVILAFVAGFLGSLGVARLEDAEVILPSLGELLAGLGAAVVLLLPWAAAGAFLATLCRGAAMAIGLGLLYAFVIEGALITLLIQNDAVQSMRKFLVSDNAVILTTFFADEPRRGSAIFEQLAEVVQTVSVLGAYVLVFSLLTGLLLKVRDVH